ncbi:hypothetical protein ACTJJE_25145 [Mycolicibacterium sp. 22603]|uniref:hypothetical protein n=1 Tax=Mycolicibacterium sp. 22603 TaxID=3453950 RepID=UPI003F860209
MSLTHLDSQIEGLRAQAAGIIKRANRTRYEVNSDRTLSDVGKQEKLEEERAHLKTKLGDLKARERELIINKRESLERQLFGLTSGDPSQIIAYRDAQDRATKLADGQAAAELLASATRSGDRTLAAAIAARALREAGPAALTGSYDWRNIVNTYAENHPSDGDKLKDLLNLSSRKSTDALFAYMPPL